VGVAVGVGVGFFIDPLLKQRAVKSRVAGSCRRL